MAKKTGRNKKGRRRGARKHPAAPDAEVRLSSYKITCEPLHQAGRLPPEVAAEQEEIYDLLHSDAGGAIPRLERLKEQYEDVPMLQNWLSRAYSAVGEHEKSKQVAEENYKRNPGYLFARINYAEICLQEGRARDVPRIFNHTFDLKMLYPDREEFHITEVVGFFAVMGLYFLRTNEEEIAQRYSDILNQLAPDDPATIRLNRSLVLGRLKKLLPFKR